MIGISKLYCGGIEPSDGMRLIHSLAEFGAPVILFSTRELKKSAPVYFRELPNRGGSF